MIVREIKKADRRAVVQKTFDGGFFETGDKSELVQDIQKIAKSIFGKRLDLYYGLSWTEASVYKKFGEVVILGPGIIGQPHKENEYINLKSLAKVNKIYSQILHLY